MSKAAMTREAGGLISRKQVAQTVQINPHSTQIAAKTK
jgi:hypothetical protein